MKEHGTGERVTYQQPEIVDYGDLLDLTAGATDGCELDADFPAGSVPAFSGPVGC